MEALPYTNSTNILIWMHHRGWVKFMSIFVNLIQALMLLFVGISANLNERNLQFIPGDFGNIVLVFFVVPVLCLFLSIKLVQSIDVFIKEEMTIKHIVYNNRRYSLWQYLIGSMFIAELFSIHARDSAIHRYILIRELVIVSVMVYATARVCLIQQEPISVQFKFFGLLFVLDFDESLYKLAFSTFVPKLCRRRYLDAEAEKGERFMSELNNAKLNVEVAYMLQLFMFTYGYILLSIFYNR